ncbi:MAG: hypothetical protein AAGC70_08290 [Pseudomonadota bacterium]
MSSVDDDTTLTDHPEVAPASPAETAFAAYESIFLKASILDARVVAFAAPTDDAPVDEIARGYAKCVSSSGHKVLFLDLNGDPAPSDEQGRWDPSTPINVDKLVADVEGFDRLTAIPDAGARGRFNNVDYLKRAVSNDLESYPHIVLQLPPILSFGPSAPNPLAITRIADAVLLVCTVGRTAVSDAADATQYLRSVNAPLVGTVVDETNFRSPGKQMAGIVRQVPVLKRLVPFLESNRLLNP